MINRLLYLLVWVERMAMMFRRRSLLSPAGLSLVPFVGFLHMISAVHAGNNSSVETGSTLPNQSVIRARVQAMVDQTVAGNTRPARDLPTVSVPSMPSEPLSVSLAQIDDASNFYTQSHRFLAFYNMNGLGIYPFTQEVLDYLARFELIWTGGLYAIPSSWVDYLHTHDGVRRSLVFYDFFLGVHFVYGKDSPEPFEVWQVDFLDNHLIDFYTINPLIPPDYTDFAPGRYAPGLGWLDYFANYGKIAADEYLVSHYYNDKRAEWDYDGIFFDLVGSHFLNGSEIQDPNDPESSINALSQYQGLSFTRDNPGNSYDQNGGLFLQRLRQRNPDPSAFPIWGNQAFRSGNLSTGANEYYRYLNYDMDESTFTTWYNTAGWKAGVRVNVDGTWYENANPVETKIIPFFDGVETLQPLIQQSIYGTLNYGNGVNGIILNYLRPYYRIYEDGYQAATDREAIYYSYATSKVIGIPSYAWDFFDTLLTTTGIPGAPATTGLPAQGYYKWAQDPIYFLDLGEYADTLFQTVNLGGGRTAVLRFFEKGFVIINASVPAQDIIVDLSATPNLKGLADGAYGYHNHFTGQTTLSSTKNFSVPAAYYPLADTLTNSARVYSYTNEDGMLIGTESGVASWIAY